jgi:hypothetical protein
MSSLGVKVSAQDSAQKFSAVEAKQAHDRTACDKQARTSPG